MVPAFVFTRGIVLLLIDSYLEFFAGVSNDFRYTGCVDVSGQIVNIIRYRTGRQCNDFIFI